MCVYFAALWLLHLVHLHWGVRHICGLTACLLLPCGCCRGRDIVQQKKQELLELIKAEGLVPVGDVKL
jgi:hypothetical protein